MSPQRLVRRTALQGPVGRRGRAALVVGTALLLSPLAPLPAAAAEAGVFVVTSNGDGGDRTIDGVCASTDGTCTLRAALQEANAHSGHAEVRFDLPGASLATIAVATRLPNLTNPAGITVDGYTQPGSTPNTAEHGSNARLMVQVRAVGDPTFNGFNLYSPSNVIRGLSIHNVRIGIYMAGDSSSFNAVLGNFLCTDATGTFRASAVDGGAGGVAMRNGADRNVVGTPALADRNVISGCAHRGVTMSYAGTVFNVVQNNVVGLTPDGSAALPNRAHGIDVNYSAQDNLIGGTGPREGNVSSGNLASGIEVSHGNANRRNRVIGNSVGTDITGTQVLPHTANADYGVHLEGDYPCDPCDPNAGFGEVAYNVVVGNAKGGIMISKGQQRNSVHDNKVGVLPSGAAAGNAVFGIRVEHGSVDNTIGPGNEVAYNERGVQFLATGTTPPNSNLLTVRGNRLTQNSLHDNGRLGIDLAPLNQVNIDGVGMAEVQDNVQAPRITTATTTSITGTTCASCEVEAFLADTATSSSGSPTLEDFGEGRTYLASATASTSGAFTVAVGAGGLAAGQVVTVNTTDPAGNTSEFSRNVVATKTLAAPTLEVPDVIDARNHTAVPVSGTTEPGATVQLTATDGGTTARTEAQADTAGRYATTLDVSGLADAAVTFTATATNAAMTSPTTEVTRTKNALPGAPKITKVLATHTSLTPTWTAPADTGGAPVTSYRLSVTGPSGTASYSTSATTLVVNGLTEGSTYALTVVATTSAGSGPASPTVKALVKLKTAMSIALSSTRLAAGDDLTVSGRLSVGSTGAAVAGRSIAIYQRNADGSRTLLFSGVPTDANGDFQKTFPVTSTKRYFARFNGDRAYTAVTSPVSGTVTVS